LARSIALLALDLFPQQIAGPTLLIFHDTGQGLHLCPCAYPVLGLSGQSQYPLGVAVAVLPLQVGQETPGLA
jgi:hypothetical protein